MMDGYFFKNLPKTELHAHLNASLSNATLLKLIEMKHGRTCKEAELSKLKIGGEHNRSLEQCFEIFALIHQLVDSIDAVCLMAYDVVKEFAEDNVKYLELRTTPKAVPSKFSKKDYCEAVLKGIRDGQDGCDIRVGLLVSIDRARGVVDAAENLQLTKELRREVPNESEVLAILEANVVDRIGHGTFIHLQTKGSEKLTKVVKDLKIPIEICLTSNWKSGTVPSIKDNHFLHWYKDGHPISICTDDKGIFGTSLSEELQLCQKAFDLKREEIMGLCSSSIEMSFLPHEEKKVFKSKIDFLLNNLTC